MSDSDSNDEHRITIDGVKALQREIDRRGTPLTDEEFTRWMNFTYRSNWETLFTFVPGNWTTLGIDTDIVFYLRDALKMLVVARSQRLNHLAADTTDIEAEDESYDAGKMTLAFCGTVFRTARTISDANALWALRWIFHEFVRSHASVGGVKLRGRLTQWTSELVHDPEEKAELMQTLEELFVLPELTTGDFDDAVAQDIQEQFEHVDRAKAGEDVEHEGEFNYDEAGEEEEEQRRLGEEQLLGHAQFMEYRRRKWTYWPRWKELRPVVSSGRRSALFPPLYVQKRVVEELSDPDEVQEIKDNGTVELNGWEDKTAAVGAYRSQFDGNRLVLEEVRMFAGRVWVEQRVFSNRQFRVLEVRLAVAQTRGKIFRDFPATRKIDHTKDGAIIWDYIAGTNPGGRRTNNITQRFSGAPSWRPRNSSVRAKVIPPSFGTILPEEGTWNIDQDISFHRSDSLNALIADRDEDRLLQLVKTEVRDQPTNVPRLTLAFLGTIYRTARGISDEDALWALRLVLKEVSDSLSLAQAGGPLLEYRLLQWIDQVVRDPDEKSALITEIRDTFRRLDPNWVNNVKRPVLPPAGQTVVHDWYPLEQFSSRSGAEYERKKQIHRDRTALIFDHGNHSPVEFGAGYDLSKPKGAHWVSAWEASVVTMVAHRDNRLVGVCIVMRDHERDDTLYIALLGADKAGLPLIEATKEWGEQRGYKCLSLHSVSEEATAFYERMGFITSDEAEQALELEGERDVVLPEGSLVFLLPAAQSRRSRRRRRQQTGVSGQVVDDDDEPIAWAGPPHSFILHQDASRAAV